ncbi:MAG: hypothetical protein QG602_1876, partial [Verrucomicrobiota bacterium]|nr:hypothetical protein [Verrucomicrobiota bacterium]
MVGKVPPATATWRTAAPLLWPGLGVIVLSFGIIRVGVGPELTRLLDNVHWTTAYALAAALAWLGVRDAGPAELPARRVFAWGLTAYAFGQVLWDVQVAVGWNPFPGPSDLFFICLGPACALGLWRGFCALATPAQIRTIVLDAAALTVSVLALTLALYLPRRGDLGLLPLAFLVAYPVCLLGALCIGVVMVLTFRPRVDRSWLLFLLALLINGMVWMHWNSLTLDNALEDGTWYNFTFSVAAVLGGLGVSGWRLEPSADPRWQRGCDWVQRLLPLLLVVAAAASLMVGLSQPAITPAVRWSLGAGSALVVILATVRQSMLLQERDRLLEAEKRMRTSEQRFKALVESAHDAIFLLSETELIDCNPRALDMFGARREQIIGQSPVALSAPEQAGGRSSAEVAQAYFAEAQAGRTPEFQWRSRRLDGTVFDTEVSLNPIVIGGQPLIQAIIRDISARKRVEEELRLRTALFEAQLNSTLDGILVVDAAGRKILQNRRFAEVWKIPAEVASDPDDARQLRFVTERTRNPKEFVERVTYLYAHPTEVSREVVELVDGLVLDRYSAPVQDDQGRNFGRIWSFRDITDQRRLEERLRQSQKMEAVGQLSGGIAHDFNNLLTAIIGHLGLLRDRERLPADMVESFGEIDKAARRAANLTSQLLAFSRLQVVNIRPLDLNEVITQLTKMLRRLLGEHIAVQLDFSSERLLFNGDASMIDQVLVNLAVNARDAMPSGGALRIATGGAVRKNPATDAPPEPHVCLTVTDTGTGIPPENISRIFDPFFTTKEVGKGTGLGLATVFGIVQQHHGWIEVESEVGRGTTFRLWLPRLLGEPAPESEPAPTAPARGRGEVILLVEDEPSVREVGVRALRSHGYRVLPAANGQSAL